MTIIRNTVFTAVSATLLSASFAAADGPQPPIVYPPTPPAVDWTGPYGGLILSFDSGKFGNDATFPGDGEGGFDGQGLGIVLGYDWQRGNMVFGGELTFGKLNGKGDEACANPAFDCGIEMGNALSVRARVGALVNPQTLVYGTVGWEGVDVYAYTDGPIGENGESQRLSGAVFGVGIEHMFNEKWSVRAAILRHNLGEADFNTDVRYTDISADFTSIEIGAVFRF